MIYCSKNQLYIILNIIIQTIKQLLWQENVINAAKPQ